MPASRSNSARAVSLSPVASLGFSEPYSVVVTTDVLDTSGGALGSLDVDLQGGVLEHDASLVTQ